MTALEKGRKPTIGESLFVLAGVIVILGTALLVLKKDVHIPLIFSSIFVSAFAMTVLKLPWKEIEDGLLKGIFISLQACIILYIVGMLIGTWILSGVVPTMIYYGLQLLSPGMFLLATLLICSIVSTCTGTSWGTCGTVGLALAGIGDGLGIPLPMTVGFVISGAYFGDKMSPLSDTTNLAPAISGAELYDHIRGMFWTTMPTYAITVAAAYFLGKGYAGGNFDTSKIEAIRALLNAEFSISFLGFLPPILVVFLAARKKPAIPGIVAGVLFGVVLAMLHGVSYSTVLDVMMNGYKPSLAAAIADSAGDLAAVTQAMSGASVTGIAPQSALEAGQIISRLMGRGGLMSMTWTITLILCALSFGGILERCGYIEVLLDVVLKKVKSVAGLVGTVLLSCFLTDALTGAQYLAIALPGRLFKKAFEQSGLHPRMLSRSLEDSGTLTPVLIPWSTDGAFLLGVFGIGSMQFAPYAILNWLNPLVAFAMTLLGIGTTWRTRDGGYIVSRTPPKDLVTDTPFDAE